MKPRIELTELVGQKFGLLTVTNAYRGQKSYIITKAKCECGGEWQGYLNNLKTACTRSCGCLNIKRLEGYKTRATDTTTFTCGL